MAVYTKLDHDNIEKILSYYSIGKLEKFEGIEEGIENSNFLIMVNKKKYILTVYEKRVKENDLPFFSELMASLNKSNFKCPKPILNNEKSSITDFNKKKLMIVSFIEGRPKVNLSPDNCKSIGVETARLHKLTKNLKIKRRNDLSVNSWRKIFEQVKHKCIKIHKDLPKLIEDNLNDVEKNWPKNLPKGIIHADLFQDNIFFKEDKISGVIDFYFSCKDFIAYEIALTINAWCFDVKKGFKHDNYVSFMQGFNEHASLNEDEVNALNILLRGAALRILITRLHDKIYHPKEALVIPKDPREYLNILKWHQENNITEL